MSIFLTFKVNRQRCTDDPVCRVSWRWPCWHRDAHTSGPWWVALVLSPSLSHACTNWALSPRLQLGPTRVRTQSVPRWKSTQARADRWITLGFSSSVFLKVCSHLSILFFFPHSFLPSVFSPSLLHLCCWYYTISLVPSAPGTNCDCLSTAFAGCLCPSLTPYGPLCMFWICDASALSTFHFHLTCK